MKISGNQMTRNNFTFFESYSVNFEKIYEVLLGNIAGCIFRNVISNNVRENILNNFWNNKNLKQRKDGVPGDYIGTYHYKKGLDLYLEESKIANEILNSLFKNVDNIFDNYICGIENVLKYKNQSCSIRPAKHNFQEACRFQIRSWTSQSENKFALLPHDDVAQCISRNQLGFEIQSVVNNEIIATNLCIENQGNAILHYWNIQPDEMCRKRLGLEEIGYPYLEDDLKYFDKIELDIFPGDIYCFNGKNVHAVGSTLGKFSRRTTISCLMGFNNKNEIIYWT